jgi:phage terminase large subunit-like protein
MLREAIGGLVARPEGFVIWLSTQSTIRRPGCSRPSSSTSARSATARSTTPRSLPVIYEFPDDLLKAKAYLKPEYFYVTNPNLGRSVDAAWLQDELTKAVRAGKDALQTHLAKHLNVEPGMAARSDNWAGAEFWKAAPTRRSPSTPSSSAAR